MTNESENLGTRYRIDASRSEFTVQAFAEEMLSFMGHNPTFVVRRYGGEVRVVLMSTTEGEDKPLKYPTIFQHG